MVDIVDKIDTEVSLQTVFNSLVSLTNWRQFFMRLSCFDHKFPASSHCQSSCGFTRREPSGSADYFDNVMTKFIVNNRTGALKTDINLFFYDSKLSNYALSLADASHEFQIHVSVPILTIKISQWARVNFCSHGKKPYCVDIFLISYLCYGYDPFLVKLTVLRA